MSETRQSTAESAVPFVPASRSLSKLRAAAAECQGCDLYLRATQTVFGLGRTKAQLMLIGETPGDQEDLAGKPFVGPAGKLLDDALADVGYDRAKAYVTNAVKHFKWEPRGERRLHAKPSARQINACRPWLEAEIEAVEPELIVCLGATAAQGLLGRDFRITRQRGQLLDAEWAPKILATYHPSAILRAPDEDARHVMRAEFVSDLRTAVKWLAKAGKR